MTAMAVDTRWRRMRRRSTDDTARMATAPPSMTSTGRIER